jgi:hypothetical protein
MAQASYTYQTRRVLVVGQLEHVGDDFRMDTAFFNQPGVTRAWQYVEPMFYPDATGNGWLKRWAPYVFATRSRNHFQGGSEEYVETGLRVNFTRQGFLRAHLDRGHEPFAGRRFHVSRASVGGDAQFRRWLRLGGWFDPGQAIFYDAADPFGGMRTSVRITVGFQPNPNLNHDLTYNFVDFARLTTGEQVFDCISSTCATRISSTGSSSCASSRNSTPHAGACSATPSPPTSSCRARWSIWGTVRFWRRRWARATRRSRGRSSSRRRISRGSDRVLQRDGMKAGAREAADAIQGCSSSGSGVSKHSAVR